jgi:hypothetical protein
MGKLSTGYLFGKEFQTTHFERGTDCNVDFWMKYQPASQVKEDIRALYGSLFSAHQGGVRRRILMNLYVSQDPENLIVNPQAAYQALGTCFHTGFLRLTPPLCDSFRSPSM